MIQIVTKPTRIDPKTGLEAMLHPIIMTMSHYYQEPLCLDPLDCDSDKIGKKIRPQNTHSKTNNKSARKTRTIKNRPITPFGIKKMQSWLMEETWENVFKQKTHMIKQHSSKIHY